MRTLPTRCKNDLFLMEDVVNHMNTGDITKINYCRLYLQVTTLSDIVSADGKYIKQECYNCTKTNQTARTTNDNAWPRQGKPGKTEIKAWQTFLNVYTAVDSLKLEQPLGEWTLHNDTVSMTGTNVFYHTTRKSIIQITDDEWQTGVGIKNRRGIEVRGWIPYYGTKDNHLLIPAGPAKEHQNGKSIITWRNRAMKPQTEIPTEPSTWKEHIHRQQGYIREILMESDINFFTTLQLLQNTSRTIIT